ncbi:plasmid mobilization protein [Mucilaginibacter flavus]|uniref:plasmid mobilization protein n=1 Tax=Mucilaginibacter flavus TaxID=931504 RepID=UPI0025B300D9|nr:plasmid mobilization relaxosome protein MobC [Mucilaginibacter flavus]MDN3581473.1 plasmid mobilization relaxosome protein MobC [Mucilaginibacter flavus]
MARPKLSEDNRRSINFTVRLTPAELRKLEELARLCGKAPGSLMRERFFKGKFPEPKMPKIDSSTYYELKKIGVNLNQLARKANANIMPTRILSLIAVLQRQQESIIKLLLDDSQSENW